ncbi:MAG: hypothetical protein ACR2KU_04110, partial [Gammaproteobacteria bacterium]
RPRPYFRRIPRCFAHDSILSKVGVSGKVGAVQFDRVNELRDALELFSPVVALRGGWIVAYASAPFYWKLNHGVAETEEDMQALIVGAGMMSTEPTAMLVPVRQASFFRWCLH